MGGRGRDERLLPSLPMEVEPFQFDPSQYDTNPIAKENPAAIHLLGPGTLVRLVGLKKRAELNGKTGVITDVWTGDRCPVKVEVEEGKHQLVLLRPNNCIEIIDNVPTFMQQPYNAHANLEKQGAPEATFSEAPVGSGTLLHELLTRRKHLVQLGREDRLGLHHVNEYSQFLADCQGRLAKRHDDIERQWKLASALRRRTKEAGKLAADSKD